MQTQDLLAGQSHVLDQIARGAALPGVLDAIAHLVERESPGIVCSIILLDETGSRLRVAAAPSLPASFRVDADDLEVGPRNGCCGAAAYRKEQVISADITTDPLWTKHRDWMLSKYGVRGCWSTPILSMDGRLLGTLAMYFRTPKSPTPEDGDLIAMTTNLAGIAIERAQAEKALTRGERTRSALIEALPDLVFRLSREGKFIDYKLARGQDLFLPPERFLGKHIREVMPEEVARPALCAMERALDTGRTQLLEYSLPSEVGPLHYEGRVMAISETEVLLIVRDISERKRAEQALLFKVMFESLLTTISTQFINVAPEGIDDGITDALRRIGEFNGADSSYVMLLSPDRTLTVAYEWARSGNPRWTDVRSRPFGAFISIDRRLERLEPLCIGRSSELPDGTPERRRLEHLGVKSFVILPLVSAGQLVGILGFDSVTSEDKWSSEILWPMKLLAEIVVGALDRKRAHEALRESHRALADAAREWQSTFDAVDSAIWILDEQKRVTRMNGAASRLDRLGCEEPWKTTATLVGRLEKTREPSSSVAQDAVGGRSWEVAVNSFREPEARRTIAVAREITETVALQRSLRRSEVMSAMGRLVAGVAHEVRNPLFGISANLDAFSVRFGEDARYRPFIATLKTEVDRLSALMQALLDYGKPALLDVAPGSLQEVVHRAVDRSRPVAEAAGVTLVVEASPHLPAIPMDSALMAQVFSNLLENAIQHSPRGGSVVVRADEICDGPRRYARAIVRDSGPGFGPEDLPRLFEPFFTRRRGGTGLGLSIVERIVQEHRGRVLSRNRDEGPGAQIEVWLPARALSP